MFPLSPTIDQSQVFFSLITMLLIFKVCQVLCSFLWKIYSEAPPIILERWDQVSLFVLFFLYITVYSPFCGFTTLSGIWIVSLTKLQKKQMRILSCTVLYFLWAHIMKNQSTNEFNYSSKLSFENLRNTYNCLLEFLWMMCRHSKLGDELIILTHIPAKCSKFLS